jgi:hypothetical protein
MTNIISSLASISLYSDMHVEWDSTYENPQLHGPNLCLVNMHGRPTTISIGIRFLHYCCVAAAVSIYYSPFDTYISRRCVVVVHEKKWLWPSL